MSPIKPNGKVTRSSGLHAIPPSQDVSRYQAYHRPDIWGPTAPPISYQRAFWAVLVAAVIAAVTIAMVVTL